MYWSAIEHLELTATGRVDPAEIIIWFRNQAATGNGGAERAIRCATTLSVIVLAVIAAIISYKHMYLLVRRYGETSWTAALLPCLDPAIAA